MKKIIILIIFCSTFFGCDQIIPKIELRDNYQGKTLLEPNSYDSFVTRDNLGNPIIRE